MWYKDAEDFLWGFLSSSNIISISRLQSSHKSKRTDGRISTVFTGTAHAKFERVPAT